MPVVPSSCHRPAMDSAAKTPSTPTGAAVDQHNCAVCLEPVKGNMDAATKFKDRLERPVAILSCGHCFHLDCIGNAFNAKGGMVCPCCRCKMPGSWNTPETPAQHPAVTDLFVSIQRAVLFRELLQLRRTPNADADMERMATVARQLLPSVHGVRVRRARSESTPEVRTASPRARHPRRRRPQENQENQPPRSRRRVMLSVDTIANSAPALAPSTPVMRRVVCLAKAEMRLLQSEIVGTTATERLEDKRSMLAQALGAYRCALTIMQQGDISPDEVNAARKFLKRHITDAQGELRRLHQSEVSLETALLRRIGVLREMEIHLNTIGSVQR